MSIATTKLEAVNRLLRYVAESPVTSLDGAIGEDANALKALDYAHREVCMEQWPFSTEQVTLRPNADGEILLGRNVLGVSLNNEQDRYRWVVRGNKMYDKQQNLGFKVDRELDAKITILVDWEDMQEHCRQLVIATAARTWVRDKLQDPQMIASMNQEYVLAKQRFTKVELGNHPVNLLDGHHLNGWQRPLAGNWFRGRSWPV